LNVAKSELSTRQSKSNRQRDHQKYKGVGPRMTMLKAEMKVLRNEWSKKLAAKAAAQS
jgi:hypothetical protein